MDNHGFMIGICLPINQCIERESSHNIYYNNFIGKKQEILGFSLAKADYSMVFSLANTTKTFKAD